MINRYNILIILVFIISFNSPLFAQKIYTSDVPLKLIVKEICGSSISVDKIINADTTNTKFILSPKTILKTNYAKAIVYNSDMAEPWIQNIPSENKININDLLDTLLSTRMISQDSSKNQYFYLSPKLLKLVIPLITNKLISLDSLNSEKYTSNSESFMDKLDLLDILIKDVLKNARNRVRSEYTYSW